MMARSAPIIRLVAILGVIGVLVTLFVAGYQWGKRNIEPIRPNGLLEIDPRDLDFGIVDASSHFNWKVRVRNTSEHALYLEDVRTACNCTQVNPKSGLIPVGAQHELTFVIDTTPRNGSTPTKSSRPFSVSFQPVLGIDTAFTHSFTINGKIRDPLWAEPPGIAYGGYEAMLQGQAASAKQVAIHILDQQAGKLDCSCNPTLGTVSIEKGFGTNAPATLVFTPATQHDVGPFHEEIIIRSTDDQGRELFRSAIPLAGMVVSPVVIHPPIVIVSGLRDGALSNIRCNLWLRNGLRILEPPLFSCTDQDLTVNASDPEFPATSIPFTIELKPGLNTHESVNLRVTVKSDDGGTYDYDLPVAWHFLPESPERGSLP